MDLGNGNVLVSFLHLSALVNTHKGSEEARLWLRHIFSINGDLYCSKLIKHVKEHTVRMTQFFCFFFLYNSVQSVAPVSEVVCPWNGN